MSERDAADSNGQAKGSITAGSTTAGSTTAGSTTAGSTTAGPTGAQPVPEIADCKGLTHARAVWDFTTGDARRFLDRAKLMLHAAISFRQQGVTPDFVVLLHSGSTKFGALDFSGTKFAGDDAGNLAEIHTVLRELTELGGRIEVCEIAMQRSNVPRARLVSFVEVEENVFVNSIALQNRGYAYIPID